VLGQKELLFVLHTGRRLVAPMIDRLGSSTAVIACKFISNVARFNRMRRGRRAVAGAVTIAVLFLITAVAAVLIFSYFTGFLRIGAPGTAHVTGSGTIHADPTGLSAMIAVAISNSGTTPVVSLTFTCPASQFIEANCGGLSAFYNGAAVSSKNPLPEKGVATGTATVSAALSTTFSYGTLYSISCSIHLSDGTIQTITIPLSQG